MHQLKWVGEAGERSEPIITKCYSCKICSTIVESCGFVKYSCTTVVTYKKYKIYSCTTKFTVVTYKSFRFRPFFFLRRYLGTLGKNAIRAKKIKNRETIKRAEIYFYHHFFDIEK